MSLLEQVSIHAFIQKNAIRTEAGEVLDFKKYRFLYDIYSDRSPLIVCMKCAQIGFTTYEILKTAHECYNEGIDILYVLPTSDDVKRFSGGKTNKIIAQNPILQQWTNDKDSVEQKQFGKNTVYYQGSWTERAALMITAKKLVVDEYDRCKPEIVEMYDSRLQSIANPKKAFFSNPSSPDFGVDKWYKKSDQKKWHITHSCGKTYVMDENSINYDKEIYECPYCFQEITDEERRMGEWKATSKGEWSGYWIPLWIAPWMPASKIAEMKRDKSPDYFANFVAGKPWAGSGNKISVKEVLDNVVSKINDQGGQVVIGVDSGLPIHYTIGNEEGLFYYGTCTTWKQIEQFMKNWSTSIVIADQGGDLIGPRELQDKYPGRVFLVYSNTQFKDDISHWDDNKPGIVNMDRNGAVQYGVDHMREKRVPLFGTKEEWEPYANHWANMIRKDEASASGIMKRVWQRFGPDHYVFCTLFYFIGINRFNSEKGGFIGGEEEYKYLEGYIDKSSPFV
jgi:hypothetical protein